MIAQVARLAGSSVTQTASESYALTLWAFIQSQERERLDSIVNQRREIDQAYMMAAAFHDPKKLSLFENQWRADVTRPADLPATREELSRRADEIWEQHAAAFRRNLPVS